ncbi:hypothetical protein BCR44DRAFT_1501696 [Catenaria anguillulae PL171]|uniref:SH3 domain-containing protein n=1 Tax=Catenaria anguillulae PL171 TaxID=765915 RepID=A0A1Y2HE63_9FUNG|nr:hypothetical protein BCR44DRAFT_1501696 [Catenaria anguillulae PL171]
MHACRVLFLLSILAALLAVSLAQGNSGNSGNGNGNGNGNNSNRPQQPQQPNRPVTPVTPPPTTNNDDDAPASPPPTRNSNNGNRAQPQTRQDEDPCPDGVCQAPGGRGRCLLMEKTRPCRGFKNLWLPLNMQKYFEDRFPLKRTDLIPQFSDIQNATTFNWFFSPGQAPWVKSDWMGRYRDEYMIKQVGCNVPTQQWYDTWVCLDMLRWAVESGSPCARGQVAPVCKSTIDERITSIERDVYNATTCSQHPIIRDLREKHLQTLRTFPGISTGTNCISGPTNEEDIGGERKCGLSTFVACSRPDLCPAPRLSLPGGNKAACQAELSKASTAGTIKLTDPLDKEVNRAPMFASVGMAVLALLALIAGLAGLNSIRSRGAKLEAAKEAERMKQQEADAAAAAAAKKNKNGSGSLPQSQAGSSSTTNLLAGASLPPTPVPPMPQQYGAVPHTPQPYMPAPQQPMLTGASGVSSNSSYGMPTPAQAPAMAPEPIIATRQATMPFAATQGDEISLNPGDTVDVFQRFDDGWARGRSRTSGATGFFPYACIQPQQVQQQQSGGAGYGGRYESMGRRGR